MSATLEEFETPDEEAPATTVLATCSTCGDTHPVAKRESADDTPASTVCPACGSPSYSTDVEEVSRE